MVLAFWAGTAYANHKKSSATTAVGQYAGRGFGGGMGGMRTGGASGGSFINGTVLSVTSSTITIQNQAGGSKILVISPTTTVSKSTQGSISDVTVGSSILATGTANSDGSVTADNIQIRPAGQMGAMPAPVAGASAQAGQQ